MSDIEKILELLGRIEENQRRAINTQQEHLQIAQAQLDRSNKTVQESIDLQRAAVARQTQVTRIVVPAIVILLILLGYLLLKWRVL
ncbi:MAG: hypothetical protein R3E77_16620 [Steroidobacteraceae bacterium]